MRHMIFNLLRFLSSKKVNFTHQKSITIHELGFVFLQIDILRYFIDMW
jgi:hypothetical protein